MRKNILNFPKQFKETLELAKSFQMKGQFDKVIVSGMGGSGWPVKILTSWLDLSFPIYLSRSYKVCHQSDKKTLNIFVSYSGNTEECLSAYQEAIKKELPTAVITSNGKLKELAQEDGTPFIEIPQNIVPRMATGHIFTALYLILNKTGLIQDKSDEIIQMSENLNPEELEEKGKKLSLKLKGKIPVIYSSNKLKVLSYIWKINFNENSKSPAFSNTFPELNHNEIEGMSHRKEHQFYSLILKDPDDDKRIQKRMDLTANILNQNEIPTEIINLSGDSLLERIFSSLILSDWTSYYLALDYGVDPVETKTIDSFKEKMKE